MAGKGTLLVVALLSVSKFIDGYVEAVGASVDLPQPRAEPQVAMVCGQAAVYHNQYVGASGRWVADKEDHNGCMENKEDILDYCKKVYPTRDITNIVESTHPLVVDDWCKMGLDSCKESHRVKPYRCLEGKFQSDALLVPEPCQFDHIHNASWCWDFDKWNNTAEKACRDRGMALRSFAMLLPCGTDIFTGVEFVCCPKKGSAPTADVVKHPFEKDFPPQLTSEINIDAEDITLEPDMEYDAEETTRDPYFTRFDPRIEHEAFRAAERRLEAAHRRRIKKIMQKWTELEEKYQTIKAKSASEADKFKLRMTAHFQKLMSQLKDQGSAEKQQLVALHQQRIVAHINERKKDARACFVQALNEKPPQTSVVHKCLNRLVRALFKDRHHTISHFRHLLATDTGGASSQQAATIEHLRDVDLMVNDSIQMLDRYPSLKIKIMPEMSNTIAELSRQDSTPAELTGGLRLDAAGEVEELVRKAADDRLAKEQILAQEQRAREMKLETNAETRAEMHRVEAVAGHPLDTFDPETMEDEAVDTDAAAVATDAAVAEQHVQPLVSHAQAHEHTQGEATFQVRGSPVSGGGRGLYFTVALASIALTVALVAGVLTVRRRQRAPRNLGFVEVDQAAAPEEPHVTQMQVNGYENPTYRYFEGK